MLAEIFIVRLEAETRLVKEVPPSTSFFIPFSPKCQETDLKGNEAPSKERPVGVVR